MLQLNGHFAKNGLSAGIRNLPAWAEFCIVFVLCFGLSVAHSVWVVANRLMNATPRPVEGGSGALLFVVAHEVLALAVVLWIGRIRGWSPSRFGLRVSWKLTGVGVLLALCTAVIAGVAASVLSVLNPGGWNVPAHSGITLPTILLVTLINPVFEEFTELGYLVQSLQRFGMEFALFASICLRAFLHAYGGFNAVLLNGLIGLVFALTYWRLRQLWPPILAHGIINFVSLIPLMHS